MSNYVIHQNRQILKPKVSQCELGPAWKQLWNLLTWYKFTFCNAWDVWNLSLKIMFKIFHKVKAYYNGVLFMSQQHNFLGLTYTII
jgi:hypothetical protein